LITVQAIGCISYKDEDTLIILLAGGDKSTQAQDIKTALDLAKDL
jgi:putative component of toxin-antitoxin plasmid stabilization module